MRSLRKWGYSMSKSDASADSIQPDNDSSYTFEIIQLSLLRRAWNRGQIVILPLAAIAFFIGLWQAVVDIFDVKPFILASPSAVISAMINRWGPLAEHMVPTATEIILGFLLAACVGTLLAVLIVTSRVLEQMLYPLLVISQTVPQIAVAPLLIVWFGFGMLPKILVAFVISFFPIVVNTATGLRSVPQELSDLAVSMGGSKLAIFRRVRFPHALPHLFAGLKVGIALAVIGAVVGEFAGADKGLGYLIRRAAGRADVAYVLAAVALLSAMGIIGFVLIELLERITIPWHTSRRRQTHRPEATLVSVRHN